MIRAAFTAVGVSLALWGAGLFYVESVTLKPDAPQNIVTSLLTTQKGNSQQIVFAPWVPHTLIGVGIVTVLYAVALPRRQAPVRHH